MCATPTQGEALGLTPEDPHMEANPEVGISFACTLTFQNFPKEDGYHKCGTTPPLVLPSQEILKLERHASSFF